MRPLLRKKNWRSLATVKTALLGDPFRFDYFQAVRLIVGQLSDRTGSLTLRLEEAISFQSNVTFQAPAVDIIGLDEPSTDNSNKYLISSNMIGLAGALGPLPDHYTELIIKRGLYDDTALRSFLDIFNQRAHMLLYEAWEKGRILFKIERGETDPLLEILSSLSGLSFLQDHKDKPQSMSKATLLHLAHCSGFSARTPASHEGIKYILQRLLPTLPLELLPFSGRQVRLIAEAYSRLSSSASGLQLGHGAILGKRMYDIRGGAKLVLGPLTADEFEAHMPTTEIMKAVYAVFRRLAGPHIQLSLCLKMKDQPGLHLGSTDNKDGTRSQRLGLSSWLSHHNKKRTVSRTFAPPKASIPVQS